MHLPASKQRRELLAQGARRNCAPLSAQQHGYRVVWAPSGGNEWSEIPPLRHHIDRLADVDILRHPLPTHRSNVNYYRPHTPREPAKCVDRPISTTRDVWWWTVATWRSS